MVQVNMGVPKIQETGMEMDYISMGNPHAVMYVKETKGLQVDKMGPALEFYRGDRVNVEFVKILDRKRCAYGSVEAERLLRVEQEHAPRQYLL